MNRVDRHDQYTMYTLLCLCPEDHKVGEETVLLLECSTVSSYILCKEMCSAAGKKPLTSLEYHRSIVETLAQEHLQDSSSYLSAGHQYLGPTLNLLNKKLHLLDQHSTPHTTTVWCAVERQGTQPVTSAKHAQSS